MLAWISSAVGNSLPCADGLLTSPVAKPTSEFAEMVFGKDNVSSGGIIGADVLRVGFGVPGEEAVLLVNEIWDSMDDLSLHSYVVCALSSYWLRNQFFSSNGLWSIVVLHSPKTSTIGFPT